MSPSENDLRSALHRGEGDPLDTGRVIAAGRAVQARRRHLVTNVAATVVVVAAAVTGGVLLGRNDSGTPSAAEHAAASPAPAGAAAGGEKAAAPGRASSSPSAQPSGSTPTGDARCPATFPQRMLPGGGSPGQFGSDGALFPDGVTTIVVCSYGSPVIAASGARPDGVVLTGAAAAGLRRSLESAATEPTGASCTDVRPTGQRAFAFVGLDASGRATRVVTTTLSIPVCDTRTTNGTDVRYAWVPPAGVLAQLRELQPSGGMTGIPARPSSSGKNIGSPVR